MPDTPRMGGVTLTALIIAVMLQVSAAGQDSEPDPPVQDDQHAVGAQAAKALNEELAAHIGDLTRELTLAQETIRRHEATIVRLERQLAAAKRGEVDRASPAPLAEESVTIDESIPSASPRALFNAVVAGYLDATEGLQIGNPGEPARRVYLRTIENWRAAAARDLRSAIIWHVRVVGAKPGPGRDHTVTLIAVDPTTDVQLGLPFEVVLPPAMVNRLAILELRGGLGLLAMRGTLIPDARINEDRPTRGTFDNPPFIGPFAEFAFRVNVASIKRAAGGLKDPIEPQVPAESTAP